MLKLFARHDKTAKEFLSRFTRFMADPEICQGEKKALWDILTALRGPDQSAFARSSDGSRSVIDSDTVKDATTAVVRDALGLTPLRGLVGIVSGCDAPELAKVRSDIGDNFGHFLAHVRAAFDALDLKW